MHELSPGELLEVWENGMRQTADQKALRLLGAAFPEESPASLTQWRIGQRNALLLTLREWLFGVPPQLDRSSGPVYMPLRI